MADYLCVKPTVQNLQICDYGLNRLAHCIPTTRVLKSPDGTKEVSEMNPWGVLGSHAIQVFSYVTHPIDIIVQMLAYPTLRIANPFIRVGVDLCNKQFGTAAKRTFLIPFKLLYGIPQTISFEIKQSAKLGWSILGFNTLVNIFKGRIQTINFFAKRLQRFENVKAKNIRRGENATQKSIGQLCPWKTPFSSLDIWQKVMRAEQIIQKRQDRQEETAKKMEKAAKVRKEAFSVLKDELLTK